jgi:RNA polymerase sigma-70 factor (ECF subfamily)
MILRNQFYSDKRRAWRSQPLDQEAAERTLEACDDPEATLALDDVRLAMGLLPDEQREALIMIGAGGLSYEEVSEIVGCAVGTIKSRVSRARNRLAEILSVGVVQDSHRPSEAMGLIVGDVERLRSRPAAA